MNIGANSKFDRNPSVVQGKYLPKKTEKKIEFLTYCWQNFSKHSTVTSDQLNQLTESIRRSCNTVSSAK